MDSATVLVLALSSVVVALLAWFEINSRRNDAKMESKSTPAQSVLETLKTKSQTKVETDTQKKRTA
jgi:hypothetical protein